MFGQTLVAARSVRATVSVSAKPSKAGDFRSMTIEAIDAEVTNCKRELLTLRIKQRTRQEFKPSDFVNNKTKIAQLLTVKREKQVAAGMTDRREVRKAEKNALLAAGLLV